MKSLPVANSDEVFLNTEPSPCKTLGFALLIIVGLGGLAVAGVGLGSLGAHQGWWQAASLSQLTQTHSIIMMAVGGVGGIACLTISFFAIRRLRQQNVYINVSAFDVYDKSLPSSRPQGEEIHSNANPVDPRLPPLRNNPSDQEFQDYAKTCEETVAYFIREDINSGQFSGQLGEYYQGVLKLVWSDPRVHTLDFSSIYQKFKERDWRTNKNFHVIMTYLKGGAFRQLFRCFQNDPERPDYLLETLHEFMTDDVQEEIEFISEAYFNEKVSHSKDLFVILNRHRIDGEHKKPARLILQGFKTFEWLTEEELVASLTRLKNAPSIDQIDFFNDIQGDLFFLFANNFVYALVEELTSSKLDDKQLTSIHAILTHPSFDFSNTSCAPTFEYLLPHEPSDTTLIRLILNKLPPERLQMAVDHILSSYRKETQKSEPASLPMWTAMLEIVKDLFMNQPKDFPPTDERFKNFIECISYSYKLQGKDGWIPDAEQQIVINFIIKNATRIPPTMISYLVNMDQESMYDMLVSMPKTHLLGAIDHTLARCKDLQNNLKKETPWLRMLEHVKTFFLNGTITFEPHDDRFKEFIKYISQAYRQSQDPWTPTEEQLKVFNFIIKHGKSIAADLAFIEALNWWVAMEGQSLITLLPTLDEWACTMMSTLILKRYAKIISLKTISQGQLPLLKWVVEAAKPVHRKTLGKFVDQVLIRFRDEAKTPKQSPPSTPLLNIVVHSFLNQTIDFQPTDERFKNFIECISYSYTIQNDGTWVASPEKSQVIKFIIENAASIIDHWSFKNVLNYWSAMDQQSMLDALSLMAKHKGMSEKAIDHILAQYQAFEKNPEKLPPWARMLECVKTFFLDPTRKFNFVEARFLNFNKCISHSYTKGSQNPWSPAEDQLEAFKFIVTYGAKISEFSVLKEALSYWMAMEDKALMSVLSTMKEPLFSATLNLILQNHIQHLQDKSWALSETRLPLIKFVVEAAKQPINQKPLGEFVDQVLARYRTETHKPETLPVWTELLTIIQHAFLKRTIEFEPTSTRLTNFIECVSYSYKIKTEAWEPNSEQKEVIAFIAQNIGSTDKNLQDVLDGWSTMDKDSMLDTLSSMSKYQGWLEKAAAFISVRSFKFGNNMLECVKILFLNQTIKFKPDDIHLHYFIWGISDSYKEQKKTDVEVLQFIVKNGATFTSDKYSEAFGTGVSKRYKQAFKDLIVADLPNMTSFLASLDNLGETADYILEQYKHSTTYAKDEVPLWSQLLPSVLDCMEQNPVLKDENQKDRYLLLTHCMAYGYSQDNKLFVEELKKLHTVLESKDWLKFIATQVVTAFKALNLKV